MTIEIEDNNMSLEALVDVVSLSKHLCDIPIQSNLVYATTENFVGKIIDGYISGTIDIPLMTKKPAIALCKIQNELIKKNISLYIYDAYRPLRAVKHFAKWFKEPINSIDLERKKIHYPDIEKHNLEKLGYVAGDISRHNYGYAVDLVLFDLNNNKLLDMGACFDYFNEISHTNATAKEIGQNGYNHRSLLSDIMQKYNFIPYEKEFWHFDYAEHEIEKPMDIVISNDLKNINVRTAIQFLSSIE